jgi:hypothetical protein
MPTQSYERVSTQEQIADTPEREQSPQEIIHALTIFDSYIPVTPEMAQKPEYKMTFTPYEQEIAKGVRGSLEEFLQQTHENGENTSLEQVFEWFDDTLRNIPDADEAARDDLFLVATKMRYNMIVRRDAALKAQEKGTTSTDSFPYDLLAGSADLGTLFSQGFAGINGNLNSGKSESFDFKSPTGETNHVAHDNPTGGAENTERDYKKEAQDLIYRAADGRDVSQLNDKELSKLKRTMAREMHPDVGGDTEVFQAVTQHLDTARTKNSSDNYDQAA